MADYWVSQPKHYCKYCKIWIHDNKIAIKVCVNSFGHTLAGPWSCRALRRRCWPQPPAPAPTHITQQHEGGMKHKQQVEDFFKEKRDKKLQGQSLHAGSRGRRCVASRHVPQS